jgi:hypothetical protein
MVAMPASLRELWGLYPSPLVSVVPSPDPLPQVSKTVSHQIHSFCFEPFSF